MPVWVEGIAPVFECQPNGVRDGCGCRCSRNRDRLRAYPILQPCLSVIEESFAFRRNVNSHVLTGKRPVRLCPKDEVGDPSDGDSVVVGDFA